MNLQERIDEHFMHSIEKLSRINIELAGKLECSKYSVFYSDPKTSLKRGDVYFLGLNPRGDEKCSENKKQIFQEIDFGYCSYTDDDKWSNENHRRKIVELLTFVIDRIDTITEIKEVFSTNLYFYISKNVSELKKYGLKDIDCWEFHEEFLRIVNPKIIICNGNGENISAFSRTIINFGIKKEEIFEIQIYGTFKLKWAKAKGQDSNKLILGIPHLSRFNPNSKFYSSLEKIINENAIYTRSDLNWDLF